jgi:hypothetical protein
MSMMRAIGHAGSFAAHRCRVARDAVAAEPASSTKIRYGLRRSSPRWCAARRRRRPRRAWLINFITGFALRDWISLVSRMMRPLFGVMRVATAPPCPKLVA